MAGRRRLTLAEGMTGTIGGVVINAKNTLQDHYRRYADIGGFGAGSDITYQALAGVSWQYSETFAANAGYRYFYQDYENDGFVWDMAAHGFYAGLGIRF
jgi:opacity protein-like surface antigen